MAKIYAQVVNGAVNLIGGEEVGLPYSDEFVISIDITDVPENERPKEGFYFYDGKFSELVNIESQLIEQTTIEEYLIDLDFRISNFELGTAQ